MHFSNNETQSAGQFGKVVTEDWGTWMPKCCMGLCTCTWRGGKYAEQSASWLPGYDKLSHDSNSGKLGGQREGTAQALMLWENPEMLCYGLDQVDLELVSLVYSRVFSVIRSLEQNDFLMCTLIGYHISLSVLYLDPKVPPPRDQAVWNLLLDLESSARIALFFLLHHMGASFSGASFQGGLHVQMNGPGLWGDEYVWCL